MGGQFSQPVLDYKGQAYAPPIAHPPLISITPSPPPAPLQQGGAPTSLQGPGVSGFGGGVYTQPATLIAQPAPIAQAPAPVVTPSTLGGAPMTLVPPVNVRTMPTPSAYQVGLYRHMIWKILQNDDPALMEQLQTRLTPQGLFNALTYLRENQLDALSGPQNDPLFNSDPARLGVVVDDIAVWLAELDARQRAKIAAAVAAKTKTGASVLPVMADSTQILLGLLLVAGGFGAMWFIRRNKEQKF